MKKLFKLFVDEWRLFFPDKNRVVLRMSFKEKLYFMQRVNNVKKSAIKQSMKKHGA
jgi:hypothetical protein